MPKWNAWADQPVHETVDGSKVTSRSQNVQRVGFQNGEIDDTQVTFYLVGHGWHTGIVLPVDEISTDLFPETGAYSHCDFVEVGWGDEGFYTAEKITPGLVSRAMLFPTKTVLHVAGFQGSVMSFFTVSDLVEFNVSRSQFDLLCRQISAEFDKTHFENNGALQTGLYGDSHFYRALGKYHAANTCNVWTAKMLKQSGMRIHPASSLTAERVLRQARKIGTTLQYSKKGIKKAALGN